MTQARKFQRKPNIENCSRRRTSIVPALFVRAAALACAFLLSAAVMTGCGGRQGDAPGNGSPGNPSPGSEAEAPEPVLERHDNGYGTIFVVGGGIAERADTSSSITGNWKGKPAAKTPDSLKVTEKKVVYRETVNTDGKDKGKPLPLHMIVKRNAAAKELSPVALFVPGGGFISCRIDHKYESTHRYLISKGYAVGVFEYHIIGQGTFRDAAEDVRGAVQWVKEHGPEYGLDPERIALVGNSGGGYVAALAACKDPSDIRCVVNFYGLSDLVDNKKDYGEKAVREHHKPTSSDSQFMNGVYSGKGLMDDPEAAKEADPVTWVDGDEPPFLHFHGDEDLLVSPSQTLHLHEALLKEGEESIRYIVPGAGHADKAFRTKEALDTAADFMDRFCR